MKIKDLKDDETVYVFLDEKEEYIIQIAHIDKQNSLKKKEQIQDILPWLKIEIFETVASDLPREFDVYEGFVTNVRIEE